MKHIFSLLFFTFALLLSSLCHANIEDMMLPPGVKLHTKEGKCQLALAMALDSDRPQILSFIYQPNYPNSLISAPSVSLAINGIVFSTQYFYVAKSTLPLLQRMARTSRPTPLWSPLKSVKVLHNSDAFMQFDFEIPQDKSLQLTLKLLSDDNQDPLGSCIGGACHAMDEAGIRVPYPFRLTPTLAVAYLAVTNYLGFQPALKKISWHSNPRLHHLIPVSAFLELSALTLGIEGVLHQITSGQHGLPSSYHYFIYWYFALGIVTQRRIKKNYAEQRRQAKDFYNDLIERLRVLKENAGTDQDAVESTEADSNDVYGPDIVPIEIEEIP